MDCFVAALLAMTTKRISLHIPAARCARVVHEFFAPREGVGNAGCPLHPQPRVECSKHAR
jgi:hypothetical protein